MPHKTRVHHLWWGSVPQQRPLGGRSHVCWPVRPDVSESHLHQHLAQGQIGSIAMTVASEDVVIVIDMYSNASAKTRRAAPKSAAGDRITIPVCFSEMLTPCTSNDDAGRPCVAIRKCLYLA